MGHAPVAVMSPATMRARMHRGLDATRVYRREKALTVLSDKHASVYAARCARQGYPITTSPRDLARWEVAQEQTIEAMEVG